MRTKEQGAGHRRSIRAGQPYGVAQYQCRNAVLLEKRIGRQGVDPLYSAAEGLLTYNPSMLRGGAIVAGVLLIACLANADGYPVHFSTTDGGLIYGDLYGSQGDHGVVLAHGRESTKDDWGRLPELLTEWGFRVLAIDFRGVGESRGGGWSDSLPYRGLYFDVLGGVSFLQRMGVKQVSVIGSRWGGSVSAYATMKADPGEIQNLVLLAPSGVKEPRKD